MKHLFKLPIFYSFYLYLLLTNAAWAQSFKAMADSQEVAYDNNDYQKMVFWGVQALATDSLRQDTLMVNVLYNLIIGYYNTGNSAACIATANKLIPLSKAVWGESSLRYVESLRLSGLAFSNANLNAEAQRLYDRAAELAKTIGGENNITYAGCLNSLGILNYKIENYALAERYYFNSIEILEKNGITTGLNYAGSLCNLGIIYLKMNQFGRAEKFLIKTITALEKTPTHPYYSNALGALAILYNNLKEYTKAENIMLKVLELRKLTAGENSIVVAAELCNLGALYAELHKFKKAKQVLQQSLAILEKTPSHEFYTNALAYYGLTAHLQQQYTEAETYYFKALANAKSIFGEKHTALSDKFALLAQLNYELGRFSTADSFIKKSYRIHYENFINNRSGLSEAEEAQLITNLQHHFNLLCNFTLSGSATELFDISINQKGTLLYSTQAIKKAILQSNDSILKAQFEYWNQIRQKIGNLANQSLAVQRLANIDSLQTLANDVEKKLSQYTILRPNDKTPVYWQTVQSKLQPNEAFVEIIRYPRFLTIPEVVVDSSDSTLPHYRMRSISNDSIVYAALVLFADGSPQKIILSENDPERNSLLHYRKFILNQRLDSLSYYRYWQPIDSVLKKRAVPITKIYLSPDGIYHQINVNTLYNPLSKKYLNAQLQVVQLLSAKTIVHTQNSTSKKWQTKIELYGNPSFTPDSLKTTTYRSLISDLPGAQKEVETIGKLFNIKPVVQKAFTETAIKKINNPAILHLATHGYFSPATSGQFDNPMLRSGLLLTGAELTLRQTANGEILTGAFTETEDGILTAYEAQLLKLDSTELVVLSACETGLGEVKAGEGVYGLQRAFKVAGAKRLIMSLWRVNDQVTQELMVNFYKYYKQFNHLQTAFKEAQTQLQRKYPQPYYWGAFILMQ